ncbi:hypothetical protein [endosymbiont GvMRE of Glomus versiforme]|uniref:hypothetical protein n=1 Tax=endosymbiont GvMRE of Glomus versiforme TaxID=2039283 RepID=UPI000EDAA3AA|nr:hypothetical protein [endosymbiont GvMRE of Glomus versiforme]RHZ35559.1 hypothetical protein GvMRE_IIg11 [endosymbiont GvMRE of Glomus versiforme]
MGIKDYLPDFQGALNSFYDERLKTAFDTKSQEYKALLTEHLTNWQNTQNILIAVAVGIFLLLAIAYFWKE